ncbi:hypothetical protein VDGD_09094 [Verticillium dahliae]|nr:hypothetical protein VDGD_09094 [Verticillium dahliae]
MAAFDTPWLSHMATPKPARGGDDASSMADDNPQNSAPSGAPPTFASFSPVTLSASVPSRSSRRSTILVHQKSPLLLATPPQITRALAYSHSFLLPMNKAVGLLSWTTGDPWESFLLVCAWWAIVLYGDVVIRSAGPLVLVLGLILAMYSRRYSPLSSSGWMDDRDPEPTRNQKGHARSGSEITHTRHQKTLDEIVETLKEFTGRCNVLLGPALELTDFLSTQRTPTSATTRPALTALFVRILFCTPFWWALTLPPWRIITTRRVVLLLGTLVLTWHARVAKVARTILWRSATVRKTVALVTGLRFEKPDRKLTPQPDSDVVTASADGPVPKIDRQTSELTKALRQRSHKHGNNATGRDAGVKFTFILYENQRRWVGLGWTQSLFAYERAAWTDEHNNSVPAKDVFELPDVEDGSKMRWRWVAGSRWRVDGVTDDVAEETDFDGEAGKNGWIYYDNKWQAGRRGEDGWGKWTRRRKWYRDAELVEISEEELAAAAAAATTAASQPTTHVYSTLSEKMVSPTQSTHNLPPFSEDGASEQAPASLSSSGGGRSFFRKPLRRRGTGQSSTSVATSTTAVEGAPERKKGRRESEVMSGDEAGVDDVGRRVNLALQGQGGPGWGIGDEARMSLE